MKSVRIFSHFENISDGFRREVKNLTLFYKIYNNLAPEYLSDLIPPTVSETSNYYLRNSQNISQQVNRLALK
jgi:hypothetical protein